MAAIREYLKCRDRDTVRVTRNTDTSKKELKIKMRHLEEAIASVKSQKSERA